jgi:diguanylate cyclase (GGDEF)-like protein
VNGKLLLARMKAAERIVSLQRQVERDRETMRAQATQVARLSRHFRHASLTDQLTELPNRRYAMELLQKQWAGAERSGQPMAVVLIDIDFFKKVNDTHGHDVGDVVLKETAKTMRSRVRENEHLCRIGGEEFLVICQDGTTAQHARICAERIRLTVEATVIQHHVFQKSVTLSMGVAERTADMKDPSELLKAADEAVYRAKQGGRNQVCVFEPGEESRQTA